MSSSKKSDPDTSSIEKGPHELEHSNVVLIPNQRTLDVSLGLPGVTGVHDDSELDPADSRRVKRKLDRRILPLLFSLYTRTSFLIQLFLFSLFFSFFFFTVYSFSHIPSHPHSPIHGQKRYFDICYPRFPPGQQHH